MKPTGNVTFLFTDIEGSTRLSQQFPDSLQSSLDKHHSILNKAIESYNGFVFEIVGDAFCCAFEKAEDAVKAAVHAQLKLKKEKWDEAEIKIRIGIHSGIAEWNGNNYMGYITLARAARVMSSAYGEQVLISNDAYEQCKYEFAITLSDIDQGISKGGGCDQKAFNEDHAISFRDLGERRLKDVIQPIRIFQIIASGLREDFPPLNTLDARPNNLPVQLTSFIGREDDIKQIKNLLKRTHLLTLKGSGGVGKTRLALQAGADIIDEFSNGVFIVSLASVDEPSLILQAISKSLGLKEGQSLSPEEMLSGYLKNKEILLILDNCEHLITDCSKISEMLLRKCLKLKIISTSREALNCNGELVYSVQPLSVPDISEEISPEHLTQFESVRLFIERALAINPSFRVNNQNAPFLAELCSRLDGIPLAIELAVARIKILSLEKVCERLSDRFKLLTGGTRTALPRQQTLRALIDWSYELLSENEKTLFSRLSLFSGFFHKEFQLLGELLHITIYSHLVDHSEFFHK
jgi:class 3 adenylate cyclase